MVTSFSTHIQPLFRPGDLACMGPHGIHLDEPGWMCDPIARFGFADHGNARLVHKRLAAGEMPPDAPWPVGRISTFRQWMDDGFRP
jgi:hypothetical protein